VKLWLKVVLVTVIVLLVAIGVMALKVFGPRAFLGPRSRELTSRTFQSTPARLERGKYLANSIGCLYCHSPHDWSKPDDPIISGMEGAGQQLPYTDLPGKVFAPNLTPDKETGAGAWTDDMLARGIREGIAHDGRALFGIMPYAHYRNMPDEDLASIIVYLRSLPPVRNVVANTEIIFPVKYIMRNAPNPVTAPVPSPDLSDPVNRGRFLVNLVGCADCHTPVDNHHQPIPGMDFSGGQVLKAPWGSAASANLTPDASGIPYYDEAMFIKAMRTGSAGSRELNKIMPWPVLRNMTDQDLAGIFAYLKTLKPIHHRVDNTEAATLCPLDGAMHGAGDQNKKE
jgi:mono/diheme cytochrome c family protein